MLEAFELVAKAVADRNRLRILTLLDRGELCVCQVTAVMALAPATVSKHLAVLKAAGLVRQRKEGRWVYYRLADHPAHAHASPMLALVRALAGDPVLAADRRLLDRVLAVPVQVLCDRGLAAIDTTASPTSCC